MTKNIVLCSDGTGSKGMQKRGTNVFKLYEAVDLHENEVSPDSPKQVAFYDDGVGTESIKLLKILGGAFGLGLSRNVRQLYANVVRTYNAGDGIYLFGFSRGAFTVRTLAGLINTCGILDRTNFKTDEELVKEVKRLYRDYRSKYKRFNRKLPEAEIKKRVAVFLKKYRVFDATIKFIGVWDTVDAVGAPIDEIAEFINTFIYPFKFADSKLSPENKVEKACHALSIDDERLTFHPVMWDEKVEEVKKGEEEGKEKEKDKKDRIEQVWFAGVHSNVGGGYPKHGMSLVSLDWMMSKAEVAGLRFIDHDRELYRDRRNVTNKLYDSRSGVGVYYRYKPRDIGCYKFCEEYGITPKIHNSVIERIMQRTEGYAPGNIPFDCEFVSTNGNDKKYDDFIKEFRNHRHKGEKSLLDRAKWWIYLRRFSHYGFLGFSLIAVYFSLAAEISKSGITSVLGNLISGTGLIQIATNLLTKPFILIVIAAFYVILRLIRKKMNGIFSEFWCTHSQQLQSMNNSENINDKTEEVQDEATS